MKSWLMKQAVMILVSFATPENLSKVLTMLLEKLKKVIVESETKVDDQLVLPVVEAALEVAKLNGTSHNNP